MIKRIRIIAFIICLCVLKANSFAESATGESNHVFRYTNPVTRDTKNNNGNELNPERVIYKMDCMLK